MLSTEPVVLLTDVGKSYGTRVVLASVNLDIQSGEVVAVMGPSGCGKSTLLGIVAGLVLPDTGRRTCRGGANTRSSWILQTSPMLSRRSALDNARLGPLSFGVSENSATSQAQAALKLLGFNASVSAPAARLSGGERQRMVVARAIASEADLILADEPTAALDAMNRGLVVDALKRAAGVGAAVVIATHDPDVAAEADRVCRLTLAAGG